MPLTIIVAQQHYIALEIFVNTGPGNGLMPDGMKPLAQVDLNIHDIIPKFMKFTNLTLYRHHPGGNEFQWSYECLLEYSLCYIGLHLIQFCYIPQVMMNGIIYYTMML